METVHLHYDILYLFIRTIFLRVFFLGGGGGGGGAKYISDIHYTYISVLHFSMTRVHILSY